jgi:hypothetical protein
VPTFALPAFAARGGVAAFPLFLAVVWTFPLDGFLLALTGFLADALFFAAAVFFAGVAFCVVVRFRVAAFLVLFRAALFTTGAVYVAGIRSRSPVRMAPDKAFASALAPSVKALASAIFAGVTLNCFAMAGRVSPSLTRCARHAIRFSAGT